MSVNIVGRLPSQRGTPEGVYNNRIYIHNTYTQGALTLPCLSCARRRAPQARHAAAAARANGGQPAQGFQWRVTPGGGSNVCFSSAMITSQPLLRVLGFCICRVLRSHTCTLRAARPPHSAALTDCCARVPRPAGACAGSRQPLGAACILAPRPSTQLQTQSIF